MNHQLNHILLTIDVEDWFQVENFKQCIPFSSWQSYELRVEKNILRLLDLFDTCNGRRTTDAVKSLRQLSSFSAGLRSVSPILCVRFDLVVMK
jgi:hypothetical protein